MWYAVGIFIHREQVYLGYLQLIVAPGFHAYSVEWDKRLYQLQRGCEILALLLSLGALLLASAGVEFCRRVLLVFGYGHY